MYMYHPHAPRRIAETLPSVKLIILLRNPVDRVFSHYNHVVRLGKETLAFEEALEAEPYRLYGEKEKILANENYQSFSYSYHSYLSRGLYVNQLKELLRYFPRNQILIIEAEKLFSNPAQQLGQVWTFLGLPNRELRNSKIVNSGSYNIAMHPGTREKLSVFFEPFNEKLYTLIGKKFSWNN